MNHVSVWTREDRQQVRNWSQEWRRGKRSWAFFHLRFRVLSGVSRWLWTEPASLRRDVGFLSWPHRQEQISSSFSFHMLPPFEYRMTKGKHANMLHFWGEWVFFVQYKMQLFYFIIPHWFFYGTTECHKNNSNKNKYINNMQHPTNSVIKEPSMFPNVKAVPTANCVAHGIVPISVIAFEN